LPAAGQPNLPATVQEIRRARAIYRTHFHWRFDLGVSGDGKRHFTNLAHTMSFPILGTGEGDPLFWPQPSYTSGLLEAGQAMHFPGVLIPLASRTRERQFRIRTRQDHFLASFPRMAQTSPGIRKLVTASESRPRQALPLQGTEVLTVQ
jgi:hypothetical protein